MYTYVCMYCVYIHFPMRVQKIPGCVQKRPLHVQKWPIQMYQNSMCVPRSPEHSQNSPFYVQKNPSRTHFPRCKKINWLKFNEKEPSQSDAWAACCKEDSPSQKISPQIHTTHNKKKSTSREKKEWAKKKVVRTWDSCCEDKHPPPRSMPLTCKQLFLPLSVFFLFLWLFFVVCVCARIFFGGAHVLAAWRSCANNFL